MEGFYQEIIRQALEIKHVYNGERDPENPEDGVETDSLSVTFRGETHHISLASVDMCEMVMGLMDSFVEFAQEELEGWPELIKWMEDLKKKLEDDQ